MPGLARELPTEFAGDTAGRLWLRSAAFRLSFSPVPWLVPLPSRLPPSLFQILPRTYTTVAATLRGSGTTERSRWCLPRCRCTSTGCPRNQQQGRSLENGTRSSLIDRSTMSRRIETRKIFRIYAIHRFTAHFQRFLVVTRLREPQSLIKR